MFLIFKLTLVLISLDRRRVFFNNNPHIKSPHRFFQIKCLFYLKFYLMYAVEKRKQQSIYLKLLDFYVYVTSIWLPLFRVFMLLTSIHNRYRGANRQPLNHEPYTLITRPWLLSLICRFNMFLDSSLASTDIEPGWSASCLKYLSTQI